MPTLTPTKDTGATAKASEVLYVEPAQTVTDADLQAQLSIEGVNAPFVADFLSACLTHERCGTHLYRSLSARTNNPVLKRRYQEFGKETLRHVEVLERVVAGAGGNPSYVSPLARAVEASDSKLLEATYLGTGGLDPMAMEMAMLDAVVLAETIDHANWEAIAQLAEALPDGKTKAALGEAVAEVEPEEDKHLMWARETRSRLTMLQASSAPAAKAVMKAEDMVAQVKGWLSGSKTGSNGSAPPAGIPARSPAKSGATGKATETAKRAAAKKAPAKKASAKKASAKEAPAKKAPAKKAPAKKAAAQKAAAQKATGKKAPGKKAAARRSRGR